MDAAVPGMQDQQSAENRAGTTARENDSAASLAQRLDAFCAALEAGQLGILSWDIPSSRMAWSTNLEGLAWPPRKQPRRHVSLQRRRPASAGPAGRLCGDPGPLRTLAPCRLEYRLPGRSDREERWFEALVTVIFQDGAAVQMLGMCRDVTERLRVNREVRVRARQQETLARLGERALTDSDLQKFFNEVVTTVGEILDVELVNILELLPGDAELLLRAGIGWRPGLVGSANISTGRDTEAGYTLASGRPVIVEDLASETRFSDRPCCMITAWSAGSPRRLPAAMAAPMACSARTQKSDASFTTTTYPFLPR